MVSWVLIGIMGLQVAVVKGFEPPSCSEGDSAIIMIDREDLEDQNLQTKLENSLEDLFRCEPSKDGNKIQTTDDVTREVVTTTAANIVSRTTPDYTTNIPSSTSAEFEKTTSSTNSENEPPNDEGTCNIRINETCYWTHVESELRINFAKAKEICSSKASSKPAYLPNAEVYNRAVKDLRSKIPSEISYVWVWTGITINTNTGNVIYPSGDTYLDWRQGQPETDSSHKTQTHVKLVVRQTAGSVLQGMENYDPQENLHGVVCQFTVQ